MNQSFALAFVSSISLFACAVPAADEPSSSSDDALTAQPSGSPARYPIVLVHGFRASPQQNGFTGGSDVRGAYTQLSERYAPIFNAAKTDDARVYYQSWAGVSNLFGIPNDADDRACGGVWFGAKHRTDVMGAKLALTAPIVAHGLEMRPNDGLVTVESAKWGEFR